MRCADRLRSHILLGRAQGPAKVIQSRRGQRFRRVSFRPGGGPPLLGRFAAMRRPPAVFACRLRGASVLHFLFPGVISPGFIFLSSCGLPAALRAVSVSLALVYSVPRGPLWAVPVAVGLAYPPAGAPVWGFWGRRGGGPDPGMAGGGPGVSGVGRPIFVGSSLIAPPGLPGGCVCLRQSRWGKVAKSKVDEGAPESRCSQVLPHSRYSR